MERRSFVGWVKCPIEFSKEFNYVRFQEDRPKEIHKYLGFARKYKERWQEEKDIKITLNFAQVHLDNNGEIRTIKGVADLNLNVEYLMNKKISFFGMLNNIAHQRYQRWYNYPSFGINGLVGAKFSF